jgi:hypothetical protein
LSTGAVNRLHPIVLFGLVALLFALLPVSVAAARSTQPQIGDPVVSNLIQTPSGTRLAISVPVRYHHFGGEQGGSSMLAARMAVKLPGGGVLHGQVDRRGVSARGASRVEHHVFFSRQQTRRLLSAFSLDPQSSPSVEVAVTQRYDENADGEPDGLVQATETLQLPEPTAPEELEAGEEQVGFGHARGNDPCFFYEVNVPCFDMEGPTFTSHYLFELRTLNFPACPPVYPVSTENVTMVTESKHYTSNVFSNWGEPPRDQDTIGDDNLRGHPYTYTPWEACIA